MENLLNDTLTDPNKPALRNDGVVLQAANSNPWYVLATVFGEQEKDATWFDYDEELAAQNRRAWNGWFCAGLTDTERTDWAEKIGLEADDLNPLTKTELKKITILFKKRMGKPAKLPDRTENIEFSKIHFSRFIYFKKYVFRKTVYFDSAKFKGDTNFRSTRFNEGAYFRSARFNGVADFGSARFNGGAYFVSATFSREVDFGSLEISNKPTIFYCEVDFRSVKFISATRFEGAEIYFSRSAILWCEYV